jgi:ribosomal protein S12 methylthiotransferase accessory factor
MQPITVRWDGGARFTADIRGHKIAVDQPHNGGGADSAPMPVELLPAALGTCVALYVQRFLMTRALDATGLTVEVTAHGAANPNRIGRFEVVVNLPAAVPPKYRDALIRAAESCTVHHTLTHAPEIGVRLGDAAAAAESGAGVTA